MSDIGAGAGAGAGVAATSGAGAAPPCRTHTVPLDSTSLSGRIVKLKDCPVVVYVIVNVFPFTWYTPGAFPAGTTTMNDEEFGIKVICAFSLAWV